MHQQAMEMHKQKTIEQAQSASDLKLHLEKYHVQIKEMQISGGKKVVPQKFIFFYISGGTGAGQAQGGEAKKDRNGL